MKLFVSLKWDGSWGGARFFYRLKGGRDQKSLRITGVEGPSLEDVDARESVASGFSRGHISRRPNYRS